MNKLFYYIIFLFYKKVYSLNNKINYFRNLKKLYKFFFSEK